MLSDDAGQINIGRHALCRVRAERPVHKPDACNDRDRAARARIRGLSALTARRCISPRRGLIWDLYASLKASRRNPGKRHAVVLRTRFDRIFRRRTGFATLDRLLAQLYTNKAELLMVLDRPEILLHPNGSENGIHCYVTRRKISAGTRSDSGRDSRDAFLGLSETCDKLEVPVWDCLGSRLKVAGHVIIDALDRYVRARTRYA